MTFSGGARTSGGASSVSWSMWSAIPSGGACLRALLDGVLAPGFNLLGGLGLSARA